MAASRGVDADEVSGCVIVTGLSGAPGRQRSATWPRGSFHAELRRPRRHREQDDPQRVRGVHGLNRATEALQQDELCNRNMCALANNFVDFGLHRVPRHGSRGPRRARLLRRPDVAATGATAGPRPRESTSARPETRPAHPRSDSISTATSACRPTCGGTHSATSAGGSTRPTQTADQTAELVVAEVATRTTALLLPGWSAWLRGLHDPAGTDDSWVGSRSVRRHAPPHSNREAS